MRREIHHRCPSFPKSHLIHGYSLLFQLKNEFTVDGFSPLRMSQFKLLPTCNLNEVKVDTSEASSSHYVDLYLYFLSAPYSLSSLD
jgi:hypothetical protein